MAALPAAFITPNYATASSLETGRVVQVSAWGGSEFGYACTYSLSGAPAGVTIDVDAGIITIGTALAAGTYTFNVVATNRLANTTFASFPFTLTVVTGVTSGRTGSQILHTIYDPHSGTWGSPSGNDWTTVFASMSAAIISDQASAGDGLLRATWYTRAATTYQYTQNKFWTGIQYLIVDMDPAHNVGAKPIFQNIVSDPGQTNPYDDGPLNFGSRDQSGNPVGAMNHGGTGIKNFCALVSQTPLGATAIKLVNSSDASKISVGRWHSVVGTVTQSGGFPPNVMFIDYVIPTAIVGSVVYIDRPLKYSYSSTWWEDNTDDQNFGRGWLVPCDMGGTSFPSPTDPRAILRGTYKNVDFHTNPNAVSGGSQAGISLVSNCIDVRFEACNIPDFQITMTKHTSLYNCTTTSSSEPDKQSETLLFDNSTLAPIGGATGFQYLLMRDSSFNNNTVDPDTVQVSPRQARAIRCTFDAKTSTTPVYTFSYNGPNWYTDFNACTFTGTAGGGNNWTYSGNSFSPLTIGTNGIWNGNQLSIAASYGSFQDWLINCYEGGIVAVTANALGPITANWGYITSVTSDGSTHLLLNINWVNGTKPLSGTVDIVGARFVRLRMDKDCKFTGTMSYSNAQMTKQTVAPFGTDYDFPAGYPPQYSGVPVTIAGTHGASSSS